MKLLRSRTFQNMSVTVQAEWTPVYRAARLQTCQRVRRTLVNIALLAALYGFSAAAMALGG
jgi:hypothetical protein